MPDFYPQEKGVIKRDRTGEARDILAKELMYESLGMIPVGGMAAKMSSPAVDVLGRWIRRFRKDKPPTVPLKNIEKALKHEFERETKTIPVRRSIDDPLFPEYKRGRSIEARSYTGPENLSVPSQFTRATNPEQLTSRMMHRSLGAKEKPQFSDLWNFVEGLRKGSLPTSWPFRRSPDEVFREELLRNWRKK